MHPQNASVELKSVHFSYDGKKEVLKDISLTIPEGRTVAFVGPSGGGKTTLANLISRFFDPQSGMVKIGFYRIFTEKYNMTPAKFRKYIKEKEFTI